MDGNGRWAKNRLLPRKFGHREGVKTIDRIADCVFERGKKYLTLVAFSTENWKRPADDGSGLLSLLTILTSVVQPVVTYAAEPEPAGYEAQYPAMETVRE